jgi:hypothetical protein
LKYLLDANVLIQAHRFHYPFDIFPAFWEWLEQKNDEELIFLPDQIIAEILHGGDKLADWVKQKDTWSIPCHTEVVQQKFSDLSNWTMSHSQFTQPAKNEFLSVADSWLIALAMTDEYTIVTEEKSSPNSKKRILIPDVCLEFEVDHCNTIDLIRTLSGHF